MQLTLSGHHVDLTDAIRQAANEKFAKIASHYPAVGKLDLFLTVEKHEQKVEATTNFKGRTIAVTSSKQDLYAAISDAVRKMDKALSHRKGSRLSRLHVKPSFEAEQDDDYELESA